MRVAFVDAHREAYGVELICAVSPMAPSTYYATKAYQRTPATRSARAQRDAVLGPTIEHVHDTHHGVYGVRKVWHQLRRDDETVARCTVARPMRQLGLRGVVRGKRWQPTVPDDTAARPLDLVQRQFVAERPNQLWVADFTYSRRGAPTCTWRS